MDMLKRLAKAVAAQFGQNCEVVVHDLSAGDPENTIAAIENGHVSNRKTGEGASPVALSAMHAKGELSDKSNYLTTTGDGRILRSSTVYIKDEAGRPIGIFAINYDLTELMMTQSVVNALVQNGVAEEPNRIPTNVSELLDELIEQSVKLVGKPVAMMNKDDKVRAINFLSDAGALLITKSGDRIAKYFGISKYTLYSYLDAGSQQDE